MNPTRFHGATLREVMQQVRAVLGGDALILANHSTPDGVEILAMSEREVDSFVTGSQTSLPSEQIAAAETAMPKIATAMGSTFATKIATQIATQIATKSATKSAVSAPDRSFGGVVFDSLSSGSAKAVSPRCDGVPERSFSDYVRAGPATAAYMAEVSGGVDKSKSGAKSSEASKAVSARQAQFPLIVPALETAHSVSSAPDVMAELREMKGLLTQQFETLAWNESLRKRPLRGVLLRELLVAGFGGALSRSITERLPDDYSESQSRHWLQEVLSRNLACQAGPDIVDQGGIYALVGPTGAGKTTTAAKLAARCVMKHGAQGLGLITTDNYRIGAQDQLRIYGKILGVPVFIAQDTAELEHAISAYVGKHLVLIDTIGMGQRDSRMAEQHALLSLPKVRRLLLLNATCQNDTLDDVVRAYSGTGTGTSAGTSTGTSAGTPGAVSLYGAILTKIDEAMKLGGVLDLVLRKKLRLHFMSNGQRVPEDLHPANAKLLVHRALKVGDGASRIDGVELCMALELAGRIDV